MTTSDTTDTTDTATTRTRKRRRDAGKRRPPGVSQLALPIPKPVMVQMDGKETAIIPLSGTHGAGRVLKMDALDWQRVAATFSGGRFINVTRSQRRHEGGLEVFGNGAGAAAWAGVSNPRHRIILPRFITGTRDSDMRVRTANGDSLDMRRANLVLTDNARLEVTRFPIDWTLVDRGAAAVAA